MATLTIEGRDVDVDDSFLQLSPEQQAQTVDEIAGQIGIAPQQQTQTVNRAAKADQATLQPSQAGDIIQSLGSGVRQGIETTAGAIGDTAGLNADIVNFVMEKLGADPATREKAQQIAKALTFPGASLVAPTTEQIQGVTDPILGRPHEPQTTAGEFAKTVGEFAPAAVAGPGGLARKTALTVAPAVASEAAGQLARAADSEGVESFARLGGALAGGGLAAGTSARVLRKAIKEAPSPEVLKQTTDQMYEKLRASGISYSTKGYERFVTTLVGDLKRKGFRAGVSPKAFSVVDELVENIGRPLDFSDLDSIRKATGKLYSSADETEKAVGNLVRDAIDSFTASGKFSVIKGVADKKEIPLLMKTARETASRNIKQRLVTEAMESAETHLAGLESGLKNEFKKLISTRAKAGRFSAEERKAIQDVIRGGPGRTALNTLGKFGFDLGRLGNTATLLPTGGGLAAGSLIDPVTGVALVVAGSAAKVAGRKLTQKAAERAGQTVRAGRKTQGRARALTRDEQLKVNLRRAISGEFAVQSLQAE